MDTNKLYHPNYDVYIKARLYKRIVNQDLFLDQDLFMIRFQKSKEKMSRRNKLYFSFIANCSFYKSEKRQELFYRSQAFQSKINPRQKILSFIVLPGGR